MSGPAGSSTWFGKPGYNLDQSLRFDTSRVTFLERNTVATAAGRKKFTISLWFKLGSSGGVKGSGSCAFFRSEDSQLTYEATGKITLSTTGDVRTTRIFRDPSAWTHMVVAVDTTQGTAANRVKYYFNGVAESAVSTGYPGENHNVLAASGLQYIGSNFTPGGAIMDGYLAEYHFLDTIAAGPEDFGTTDENGNWIPIEYGGGHGTNGWYLPFKADYTVEGFSTVVWKGSGGTASNYIGGTGFQPDMVWIKNRDSAIGHFLYDSVRGSGVNIQPEGTGADATTAQMTAFNTDGFTVANISGGVATNKAGEKTVAWCWDMDAGTRTKKELTINNQPHHDTGQKKFGDTSIYFDGTEDSISMAISEDFNFGSGDFTVEAWIYPTAFNNTYNAVFNNFRDDESTSGWSLLLKSDGKIHCNVDGTYNDSTNAVSANGWTHVAMVKHNNTLKRYINGTEAGNSFTAPSVGNVVQQGLFIGEAGSEYANRGFVGYMEEMRISKGVARYTANFSVATAPFVDDSDTVLLIHSQEDDSSVSIVDGGAVNTTGGINSHVMANPTYGQSIVKYTGSGSAATVGHGLSAAPEWILVKNRQNSDPWSVYYGDNTDYMVLNTTAATADNANRWNDTSPTSSVFTVNTDHSVNADGEPYIAYCWHSVANYTKIGTYTGNASTDGSLSVAVGFKPAFVIIKRTNGTNGWLMIDNTRNSSNPVNHYHYSNTNDVEADGSICNFTSTGFDLLTNLADVNADGGTYTYMAHADKREYAYWLDSSGNNNDWTSVGLTESDISVDSPTNNFCIMNIIQSKPNTPAFSQGNLTYTSNGSNHSGTEGSIAFPTTGKWYFEAFAKTTDSSAGQGVGIGHTDAGRVWGSYTNMVTYLGDTRYYDGSYNASWGADIGQGDIVGVAYDADTPQLNFYKNNVAQPDITSFTMGFDTVPIVPILHGRDVAWTANFGQDSSFAGGQVSQGNTDGNGEGDFFYAPPSDYLALCTNNLPEPVVDPRNHFNTVLYTGDGSTQAVTGTGFQPDFVWIKERSSTSDHSLHDVVRGSTKIVKSSTTAAEITRTASIASFDTDGFSLGNNAGVNENTQTYIAWNWKAGNANTAFSESGNNPAGTHRANVAAGFSIVSYTGTGAAGTVAHGLGAAPEWILIKNRDVNDEWYVYYGDNTDYLVLDDTDATADSATAFNDTSPTATVFTVNTSHSVNADGEKYIAYCFRSIEGHSKLGQYEGNNNADGPFVNTGFRPSLVVVKDIDSTGEWRLQSSKMTTFNNDDINVLVWNASTAEYSDDRDDLDLDFLSNGFKHRSTYSQVNAARTYVYFAFAESPFKHTNAK